MDISKEDKDFWLDSVKDTAVLQNEVSVVSLKVPVITIREKQHYATKQEFTTYSKALEDNEFGGIDKSLLRRFKREEFRVEAVLDLHGLKEDEAFVQVDDFISKSYGEGKRCVIIVTGKGNIHQQEEDIFAVHGILKHSVPRWLNLPRIRSMILIYKHPSERLGGSGALYILLKKNRNI